MVIREVRFDRPRRAGPDRCVVHVDAVVIAVERLVGEQVTSVSRGIDKMVIVRAAGFTRMILMTSLR